MHTRRTNSADKEGDEKNSQRSLAGVFDTLLESVVTEDGMTQEQIRTALGELLGDAVVSSDDQYTIPADVNATVYASFTGETLAIARVTRVAIVDELAIVETARSERFVLQCSTVVGIKADLSGQPAQERGAGFGS